MSEVITVQFGGAALEVAVGENTAAAAREAAAAIAASESAAVSAAVALAAAGPNYASTAAGLAATTVGDTFPVIDENGTVTVYRHDAGPVATVLREMAFGMIDVPDQSVFPGSLAVGNMLENLEYVIEPGDRLDEGGYNTYFGFKPLAEHGGAGTGLTNQWANTGFGYGACNFFEQSTDAEAGTSMYGNTAVGFLAMPVLHAAYDNTAVGALALTNFKNGNDNTALGIKSLTDFVDGSDNTALGYGTLEHLDSVAAGATSNRNVAIGAQAGRYVGEATSSLLQADDCIFIGSAAYAGQDETQNEIVIGADARGGGPNTVTIGNESIVGNRFYGNMIVSGHLNLRGATYRQLILERTSVGSWSVGNPTETGTGNDFAIAMGGTTRLLINTSGHLEPGANQTQDLGSASAQFRDVHAQRMVVNGLGVGSGTAFPGSPATGDRFYRTDRNIEYFYDGTRWLSTQLFEHFLGTASPAGISATSSYMTAVPHFGTYSLWLDSWSGFCQRNAAGEWDLVLNRRASDGTLTALDTRDGSADTDNSYNAFTRSLGVELNATARAFALVATEVSGSAVCTTSASLFYRLIG